MLRATDKQMNVLTFIYQSIVQGGAPTRKEIADGLGFKSANAAQQHLKALERKAFIALKSGKSRGIEITISGKQILCDQLGIEFSEIQGAGQYKAPYLDVIGHVAAGEPIFSEGHVEGQKPISPDLFSPRADYLLRVSGDSMQNIGIVDGDLLAVHKSDAPPSNGAIVVARVGDDEFTVKRYQRSSATDPIVYLCPENDNYQPIKIDLRKQSLGIEGLGVGVIRLND
jgi:repressor LexA